MQREPWWWSWTARTWRRSDTDSYLCYVLFFTVFFTDYSLIAVVYHASLFVYAILAQQPSTQFWQVGPCPLVRAGQVQPCSGACSAWQSNALVITFTEPNSTHTVPCSRSRSHACCVDSGNRLGHSLQSFRQQLMTGQPDT